VTGTHADVVIKLVLLNSILRHNKPMRKLYFHLLPAPQQNHYTSPTDLRIPTPQRSCKNRPLDAQVGVNVRRVHLHQLRFRDATLSLELHQGSNSLRHIGNGEENLVVVMMMILRFEKVVDQDIGSGVDQEGVEDAGDSEATIYQHDVILPSSQRDRLAVQVPRTLGLLNGLQRATPRPYRPNINMINL
jgi:hypothetical protein